MNMPAAHTDNKLRLPSYLAPVEAELQRVDRILSAELPSAVRTITAVSSHILEAGGKRLRPALVILSAQACGGECDPDRIIEIAAGTELIHMATLMHDDVIDVADSRRGRPTANSMWGNQISILTGDYMLAKSFSLLAREDDFGMLRVLARATTAMAEGEIRQIESRGNTASLVTQYLSIIQDKTAEFMSACCRIGAMTAGGSKAVEDALSSYGLNLGLAFQITDDLLDLIGDPARTGKPVGGDIREGKITMPLILTLEKAAPDDRAALERIIHSDDPSSPDIEFIRSLAEDTGAIEGTREIAAEFAAKAVGHLDSISSSQALECLKELPHHILHRKS